MYPEAMFNIKSILWILLVFSCTVRASLATVITRPLVIWHFLGASYNADEIRDMMDQIYIIHPGIFIHSIYIDPDPEKDKKAGYVSF
jgi:palmitoyl-protein thioesterase